MYFLAPHMWWLAPLVLVAIWIAITAWGRQRQMFRAWGSRENISRFARLVPTGNYVLKGIFLSVAVGAAVFALCRPSIPNSRVEYPAGSVDFVAIVDVSRSMGARDCGNLSRMSLTREILRHKVLPTIKSNRIGIVSFAGRAAPQAYLTDQLDVIDWLAEYELKISSAPGDGSALGDAFQLAFKYFDIDSEPSRSKVIVLFSDGGTDEKTDVAAIAKGCRDRGIHLVILATGLPVPSLIPVEELDEHDRRLADDRFYKIMGKPAQTALEPEILAKLATAAGSTSSLVHATSIDDFEMAPVTSTMSPVVKVGDKEVFFYPCLIFLATLAIASVATTSRKW